MVKATLTKKRLIVSVPLHEAKPSKSRKMLLICTTHGFRSSQAMFNGQPVRVNLIAGINADNLRKTKKAKRE